MTNTSHGLRDFDRGKVLDLLQNKAKGAMYASPLLSLIEALASKELIHISCFAGHLEKRYP